MGHTPGPWSIEYEDADGELYEDGVRVDSHDGPVAFNVIDCSAPLIAAAPELLAALKRLLPLWEESIGWEEDYMDMADGARAAIAKAEGKGE